MKKTVISLLLLVVMMVAMIAPASAYTMRYVKTRSGGPIGIWRYPDTSSEKMGSLAYGQEVAVEEFCGDGWAEVVYGSMGNGYVHSAYLSKTKPGTPSGGDTSTSTGINFKKFTSAYFKVTVQPKRVYVNYRWLPSTASASTIKGQLYAGHELWVLATNGTWCQVYDAEDHSSGYVQSQFLVPADD